MCHHHWPGDGIDSMKVDAAKGEITVCLSDHGCRYVLTAAELMNVYNGNRWAEKWDRENGIYGERHPELLGDGSSCDGCWNDHIHRFDDLYRFEWTEVYKVPYIEVAVNYCTCHVMVPVEIILRLFAKAYRWESADGIIEIGNQELADWYRRQEDWEHGWRFMGDYWRHQAKERGEEKLHLY